MRMCKVLRNKRIYRTLEMTSDAPTNAGKHVTLNIACARNQRHTKDSSIGQNDVVPYDVT